MRESAGMRFFKLGTRRRSGGRVRLMKRSPSQRSRFEGPAPRSLRAQFADSGSRGGRCAPPNGGRFGSARRSGSLDTLQLRPPKPSRRRAPVRGVLFSSDCGRLLWGNDPPHGGFPLTGWGVKQNSSIRRPGEGIIAGRVGVEAVFPEFVEAPAAVDAAQGQDIFRARLSLGGL